MVAGVWEDVAGQVRGDGGGVVRWKGSAEVGVKSMVNSAYTSLWRMISDVGCCEMQMS
jgi:hypothetical protein